MAVQAQYPSNISLFNRAVQEGKNQLSNDYTLQPQLGGGGFGGISFFDQSNMSHNHGVGGNSNSSRKRGREMPVTGGGGGGGGEGGTSIVNNGPLISRAPQTQLMDLSQLQNTPQRNAVSIGLGLTSGENQQQQQSLHQQLHSFSLSPQSSAQSSVLLSILSDDLASQIKQQRDELEHFLLAQGELMRRTLAEKRQRHYRSLLSAAEESVARRLREKQAEVEKASRKNSELEAKVAQLSMESQAWQHRAKMQEHMAANLQAQLQRAIISTGSAGAAGYNNNNVASQVQERDEWGGNISGAVGGEAEDAESAYIDPDRVVENPGPSCKACRRRVASVVVLPCRHLSLCTECDAVSQACPLCLGLRSSSVEVFLS